MGKHGLSNDGEQPGAAATPATAEGVTIEFEAPREKSNTKKALVALSVILVLLVCIAAGGLAILNGKLNEMKTISDPFADISKLDVKRPTQPQNGPKPLNFLVLGSDSRISAGDPNQWKAGAQRTDAFMILQIAGNRDSINVMSIPRDSWVPIPGYGEAKINAAFSFGGPTLTIATVEQLTGIRIDHIAVVDFTSFKELTDAVGGVTMKSQVDGTRTYTGKEALAFVRERKHLPGGDFDRVRRQQLWMKTVLAKTLTKENLSSPAKLIELYNTMSPYIAVDDRLGLTELLSLATSMGSIRADSFNFVTAPYTGTGTSADGQSIVLLDTPKFKELCQAFVQDDARNYIVSHAAELKTLDGTPVA
ncbi:MAG: LCP family protein [Arcanobacterium sp.]|nr:LCP family protein [Arcanobacterium sp.]MDY5588844.1 LCP family protein [Arcanobacterium sp.]